MKKGETYTGVVDHVEFPNKGIVILEGGKVTVKNTIPGQEIEFVINKKHGDRYEGRLLQIIKNSNIENYADRCPHFGVCGGCVYQSVNYEAQLEIKSSQIKALLDPVCKGYEFEGILPSPVIEGYRNKMEFSFGDEERDGAFALGMHKRGSFYDIVSVCDCHIIDNDYRAILRATLDFFKEEKLPFYHKMKHEGYLRHLLVRKASKTGEIMIDIVTSTQLQYDMTRYAEILKALNTDGEIVSILHTFNDSLADVVVNDSTEILYGRDFIYEELLGLRFKITAFSFFQTNSLGAEVLYSKTRDYVGEFKDKVVFDLYSGTGTIAQILASVAKKVVGVEIVEEAVMAARVNAEINGLDNCEFIAGDVLKVVSELTDKPDIIILDPPRDGIHPKAIGPIMNFGVDTIVYVACKPSSLARDAAIFEAHGYRVKKVCLVDMFPGTGNTEAVALIEKEK